jgi:hypothetical protein
MTVSIDDLPLAENLSENDIVPINQNRVTKKSKFGDIRELIQGDIASSILTEAREVAENVIQDLSDRIESVDQNLSDRIESLAPEGLENLPALFNEKAYHVVGEYHKLSFDPNPLQLAKWRYLPLQYQIIEISLYQELCELKWVGSSLNATANFWYKCDVNGTRNVNGLWMRVEDARGMFYRGAGANSVFKAANNTPYDGKDVGTFQQDRMQNIIGETGIFAIPGVGNSKGALFLTNESVNVWATGGATANGYNLSFDASRSVRTGNDTAPASFAVLYCISY